MTEGDFKFPDDVRGWLSANEGRTLALMADGRDVLEIGSFCGKSTICMAQTARSVVCVDPFDGRATPGEGDRNTFGEFCDNLTRFGVRGPVEVCVGTSRDEIPKLCREGRRFDFVFIDGDHELGAVREDIRQAMSVLKPGGLLAFHDYRTPTNMGVTSAVNEFVARGAVVKFVADDLAVVEPCLASPRPESHMPGVYLALPSYDGWMHQGAAQMGYQLASMRRRVIPQDGGSSLLGLTFNQHWCNALNNRKRWNLAYFAMLHADIMPECWWLDFAIDELEATGADLLSAVSPIKDDMGETSTAIDNPKNPFEPLYRVSTAQLEHLPETFSAADCGHPDKALLVNTGCMVLRLDRPWVDEIYGNGEMAFRFTCSDMIYRNGDGEYVPRVASEDWNLSRHLHDRKYKVLATRKVKLAHMGQVPFRNYLRWGVGVDETGKVVVPDATRRYKREELNGHAAQKEMAPA